MLPFRLGEHLAAAAAGAGPGGFRPAAIAAVGVKRGAAHGDHVRHIGGRLNAITRVTGASRYRNAGPRVILLEIRDALRFAATIAVADDVRAHESSSSDGSAEIAEGVAARFEQIDLAARAHGARHVEI